MNFVKFLRTYFLQNTSGRLLLTGPYRSSGRAQIEWEELQKVLQIWKSVNRPLTYIGDDIFQQTLRPSRILRRDTIPISIHEVISEDEAKMWRKSHKYEMKCKEAAWKRFCHEYVVAIRERWNLHHKERTSRTQSGCVVIIKEKGKNRGKWKLGIAESLHIEKDELVKVMGLRKPYWTSNSVVVPTRITLLRKQWQWDWPIEFQLGTSQTKTGSSRSTLLFYFVRKWASKTPQP